MDISESLKYVSRGISSSSIDSIKNRASQLTSNLTDDLKKAAYQYAYVGATSLINAAKENKIVDASLKIGDLGYETSQRVQKIIEKFKGSQKIDASGIADIAQLSYKSIESIVNFTQAMGFLDSKVTNEVLGWTGIAGTCAASIAANPYLGVVSCAASTVLKFLDTLTSFGDKSSGPVKAIFVPEGEQSVVIPVDAMRLAYLLRYIYGVPSYKSIYDRISYYSAIGGSDWPYPSEREPPTAVDLRVILAGMMTKVAGKGEYDRRCFDVTEVILRQIERDLPSGYANRGLGDRDIDETLINDHDICVDIIRRGSDMSLIRPNKLGIEPTTFPSNPSSAGTGWALIGAIADIDDTAGYTSFHDGMHSFLRTYELIQFFSGIILYELKYNKQALDAFLGQALPVRLNAVCDSGHDCRVDWADDYSGPNLFGKKCWTTLERCVGDNECHRLPELVGKGDICAIEQLASIRLMAAFSYINMIYKWGEPFSKAPKDIIEGLPKPNPLNTPINPRQIGYDNNGKYIKLPYTVNAKYIFNKMVERKEKLDPIMKTAEEQAAVDAGFGKKRVSDIITQTTTQKFQEIVLTKEEAKTFFSDKPKLSTSSVASIAIGAGGAALLYMILRR